MKTVAKKFKPESKYSFRLMLLWVGVFAAIGVTTLLLTRAATPGIAVTVDSSIPNPTNIKTYADDRLATVTWSEPSNASGIVGYYVTWGSQNGGVYTNAKQTTYTITQIQPLTNGTVYNVKVQSVKGSYTNVATPNAWGGGSAQEARANGKVSTGITATVTPNSTRVDNLRSQMTGFFDDFNTAAGAMDELKWNTAVSGCAGYGATGAFINNQFHAHTQIRTPSDDRYCDRSENVARARGIFDITGRTEANPGIIVGDFDGTTMPSGRDTWYIDLIPLNVRTNNAPLDITSHADAFDSSAADPAMIRITQNRTSVNLAYTGNNKQPGYFDSYHVCNDFKNAMDFGWCFREISSGSNIPIVGSDGTVYFPTPNVRMQWRVEVSPTKVKVFLNDVLIIEGKMPSDFANITKYTVHSNLFSYNTGKDSPEKQQTSLLHWDNFGFNGPAQTTVVHNYIEGDTTGTFPIIGTGTAAHPIPQDNRSTKINIPDPIGSPVQARLMYTLQNIGFQSYSWSSGQSISVNGNKYNLPNPTSLENSPHVDTVNLAGTYIPFAESIAINPAHLKQGMNDIAINIDGNTDVINLHIELEYPKGSEPAYTPPKSIFDATTFLGAIQPALLSHDSYLFIEQDMGLPSGVIDSTTPVTPPPTSGDTTKPTITLNEPTNNTTVAAGSTFTASAGASDNIGVTKVEFYIGNTLKTTDTSSPYSASLSTSGLSSGNYTVSAVAYDAAGNSTTSNTRTIVIPTPPDTTGPSILITSPSNNAPVQGSSVSVLATAGDPSGVNKVEFYVDNTLIATDTTEPYAATIDSTKYTNGNHTLTAKAYDTVGNNSTSANVTVSINNAVADTTPPAVSISSPTANATISGTLAFIQATASDSGGMNKVEFYIDGNLLGTDTSSPYSFSLNTTLYNNGSHSLTAKAYDSSNNSKTSTPVVVNINNVATDSTPPSVIITSPLSGAIISGTSYTVSVTAADTNGVTKVEFSVDGVLKATDTSSPFSYALNTTSFTNASHSITAKAYDPTGNSQSATTTVTVNNAVTPPTPQASDFNGDGHVDLKDLITLLSNYGRTVTAGKNGDCTGDGKVDLKDLIALLGAYGS